MEDPPEDPEQPPLPKPDSGNHLERNEGGSFTLLDEDDVPLGTWHWDEEEEIWIFDEAVPLGDVPKTGEAPGKALLLRTAFALSLTGIFVLYEGKGKRRSQGNK